MGWRADRNLAADRARMVERQLRRRGIADPRVLEAMAYVPRERFVPAGERRRAYADSALPIGHGQTISQPWIVATICEALELSGSERVLEIGTGSGYSACVLSRLAAEVVTIERVAELARAAEGTLADLGVANVEVIVGDGSLGAPDRPPFDAIAVHATAPSPPHTLLGQLAPGGRLVVPIAERRVDMLTLFRRPPETGGAGDEELERRAIAPCRFVPLIGDEGFQG
ncbi:MAG TPA: protein-L-isoaspartate(D-aspartate) O-methyltransferase [Solirubrobacterales bacterium]|nr:protein-L-isoaspartate(D-aspartate) O-methyltransferase [Solirubrobacterales bacterium]